MTDNDPTMPMEFLTPADPVEKVLDDIRDIVANLRFGQSICIHRAPNQPKVGEPLFTIYTEGTVALAAGFDHPSSSSGES